MEWNKDTIRNFRKSLGLTQKQFAKKLGTAQVVISEWETEKRPPSGVSRKLLTLVAEKEGYDKKELEKIDLKDKRIPSPKRKENRIPSDAIRAFREKLCLNKTQLAEKLSLHFSTVSRWELGETSPDPESQRRLKSLAKQKGIDLEELVRKAKKKEGGNYNGYDGRFS